MSANTDSVELAIRYATTADGVSIAWGEAGDGPPLLHVQAPPFSHAQEAFASGVAGYRGLARSFRLIMFDPRGTGQSERDVVDVSHTTLIADAEAAIEAAKLDRFVVATDLGLLSLSTALRLALAWPDRITHLVFTDPMQSVRDLENTPYGRIGIGLAEADWDMYVQTLFRVLAGFDQGEISFVDPYAKAAAKWADPDVGLRYTRLQQATDVGELLPAITQPTLVVMRREQNIVPVRACQRVAAAIPGAQFRQYSDPNFELWSELVRDFVGQATRRPTPDALNSLRTVLITDIVGHTEMMQRLGDDRGRAVLREHERITRETLRSHDGEEVKTMGDGFMASFGSVTKAVDCAIALQRAFADHVGEPLEVRIGLNTGEPIEEDGDLFGSAVNLAARVAAQAGAREILIPEPLRHLLTGKPYVYNDRGETLLKGFEDAVRLYEVRWRE